VKAPRLPAVLAGLALAVLVASPAAADVLVGNIFLTEYDGWVDKLASPPPVSAPANWGILMDTGYLFEASDGRVTTAGSNDGRVKGFNMVNDVNLAPEGGVYHVKATLRTWDDDGFGVLFGYGDEDNFFRVAFRGQANGNLGFAKGISVQKMKGGTLTEPPEWKSTAFVPTDSFTWNPTNNPPFDVDVFVNGENWTVTVTPEGGSAVSLSGSDPDLATAGRKYGVHSWYQWSDGTALRGTELQSMTITNTNDELVRTHTFNTGWPVAWRKLVMARADGTTDTGADGIGNFRMDFSRGVIEDTSNGFEWASELAPNVDFIGPAVVVDEAGSQEWTNYEMKIRLSSTDNDGIGLLFRVQDDDTFYRVNFTNEDMGTGVTRSPAGVSVQRCKDGVWTEEFRDDQTDPAFRYTVGREFDVKLTVVHKYLKIEVIDDPDGATPETTEYAIELDSDGLIASGTVGLTAWGNGSINTSPTPDVVMAARYSPYGGIADTPLLVTAIPEPSTWVLLGCAMLLPWALRRRK